MYMGGGLQWLNTVSVWVDHAFWKQCYVYLHYSLKHELVLVSLNTFKIPTIVSNQQLYSTVLIFLCVLFDGSGMNPC